jgi:hypothetical protein
MKMENKMCKKCGRQLPDKYEYKKCENCRNQDAKKLKDIGKTVLGVGILIGGTVISIASKGKITPYEKN